MKTRKGHKQKGRGMTNSKPKSTRKTVQFFNSAKPTNKPNNNGKPWNKPGYLEDLKSILNGILPPVANVHEHNAEIMGALLESYNDPANMYTMINRIYDPQPLTTQERNILKSFSHGTLASQISRLAASSLPEDIKTRLLNFYRHYRAKQKIRHLLVKEHIPKARYIHPEWNLPKNAD